MYLHRRGRIAAHLTTSTFGLRRRALAVPLAAAVSVAGAWLPTVPPATRLVAASVRSENHRAQATIRRDEYGVPHILAESEEAAAFAHGYSVAEDHLEDLALLFLRAQGRLASVFGESRVADDTQTLQLKIPQDSRDHFTQLPAVMQQILNAYAEGYDAFLKKAGSRAPAWAQPVTGADVFAHCRAVYLLNFAKSPRQLLEHVPTTKPPASNFWALGRERSTTRDPLLLANPHLPWVGAYTFHEVHLNVPGAINVAGGALIGFPVVTVGFNERLGWTHTANMKLGAEQIYRLTLDPANPQHYMRDGRSVPFTISTATLHVKTAQGDTTRQIDLWQSDLGPVVRKDRQFAWVFNSPNLAAFDFLTEYNRMAKAQSFRDFRTALDMQQLPILSVGYADRDGNIFYIENGRYPSRRAGGTTAFVNGDRSEDDPGEILPQSSLPQLLNPTGGYIQNANNGFAFTTLRQALDMSSYPPLLRNEKELSLRAQHSLTMLDQTGSFTLDQVVASAFNPTMTLAQRLKSELVSLVHDRAGTDADMKTAADLLERWNDRIEPDKAAPALFASWWEEYEASSKPFAQTWNVRNPLQTPAGIGDPAMAVDSLHKVVEQFKKRFGTVNVPWKQVYLLKRGSLVLPAPGAPEDLGVINSLEFSDGAAGGSATWGTSYLLAVRFSKSPVARSVLPYSQSSNPGSPNYSDQTKLFSAGLTKPLWIREADVAQHTVHSYVLER